MAYRTSPPARVLRGAAAAAAMALVAACSSGSCPQPIVPARDVSHLSPAVRSRALALDTRAPVGARGEAIAAWIERLDDEDLTVRMQAYARLRVATGHDTGYRPFLEGVERRRHVDAWWAWWRGETSRPELVRPDEGTAPAPPGESPETDLPEADAPALEPAAPVEPDAGKEGA
ncbi:MAG: hypothetical protein AB7T63_12830 [Planctomycetota bacterium]